jgi:uncharacterized protein YbjT (DUF2867 family)
MEVATMKIVVIGGSGLIGSKLVTKLREHGHEAVAASPSTGVNTITGEGLAEALKGASVVVDVTNSPSWEDAAVLKFFETSTRNLLSYEAAAGVGHHVALSVVGTERLLASGFFRAKMAQENLIKASPSPIRLFARRSSSNSSMALPTFPSTATRCGCRLCFSSPWQPTMSRLPSSESQ